MHRTRSFVLLLLCARVVAGVQQSDASVLADRITVGKDGLVPPI